jgi:hypothetical protein
LGYELFFHLFNQVSHVNIYTHVVKTIIIPEASSARVNVGKDWKSLTIKFPLAPVGVLGISSGCSSVVFLLIKSKTKMYSK